MRCPRSSTKRLAQADGEERPTIADLDFPARHRSRVARTGKILRVSLAAKGQEIVDGESQIEVRRRFVAPAGVDTRITIIAIDLRQAVTCFLPAVIIGNAPS